MLPIASPIASPIAAVAASQPARRLARNGGGSSGDSSKTMAATAATTTRTVEELCGKTHVDSTRALPLCECARPRSKTHRACQINYTVCTRQQQSPASPLRRRSVIFAKGWPYISRMCDVRASARSVKAHYKAVSKLFRNEVQFGFFSVRSPLSLIILYDALEYSTTRSRVHNNLMCVTAWFDCCCV